MRNCFILSIFSVSFYFISPSGAQEHLLPSKPVWEASPTEPLQKSLSWNAVDEFGVFPPQYSPIPAKLNAQEMAARPRVEGPYRSRGIYGIGGGVRTGLSTSNSNSSNIDNSTSAIITGRVGYKLDDTFAVSVRPSGIFGPNNNNNDNNNNNYYDGFGFRLPLTVDVFHDGLITPFFGGGIATNVDNLGHTNGMLTGGIDINITKWITFGMNVNYIFQDVNDATNWEGLGMLYLRF